MREIGRIEEGARGRIEGVKEGREGRKRNEEEGSWERRK